MIRLIEEFRFGVVTRVYLTAEKTTRRGADSTRTDQIGKVFLVVGQDVRKCLVCERLFTRRSASEHSAFVACRKSA